MRVRPKYLEDMLVTRHDVQIFAELGEHLLDGLSGSNHQKIVNVMRKCSWLSRVRPETGGQADKKRSQLSSGTFHGGLPEFDTPKSLYSVHCHHNCVHILMSHRHMLTVVPCSRLTTKSHHTCPLTLQLHITWHRVERVSKLGWWRSLVADDGQWERALSLSPLSWCLGRQQEWKACRIS